MFNFKMNPHFPNQMLGRNHPQPSPCAYHFTATTYFALLALPSSMAEMQIVGKKGTAEGLRSLFPSFKFFCCIINFRHPAKIAVKYGNVLFIAQRFLKASAVQMQLR